MSGFGRVSSLVLKQFWRKLRRSASYIASSPLRLTDQAPKRLVLAPVDLRQPDIFVASEIIAGRFPLGGTMLNAEGLNPFDIDIENVDLVKKLHMFQWLRHLRASTDPLASDRAKQLAEQWMDVHLKHKSGPTWNFDIVSHRLIAFLTHSPVILEKVDQDFYQRFLYCIGRHISFLHKEMPSVETDAPKLRAKLALAMASVCVPSTKAYVKSISASFDQELDRQILPDGGHVSRNPHVILNLLADLLPLRQIYLEMDLPLPTGLLDKMDQMFSALRFFRHSSGDLGLFNGSGYVSANYLLSILQNDERSRPPKTFLENSKYARLEARYSVVLSDVGPAPKGSLSKNAHAGCLSFEFSSGVNRLIVNSGAPAFQVERLGKYARLTAAHSTLVAKDTSSARVSDSKLVGPIFIDSPTHVTCDFESNDEQIGFKSSHDGYANEFNIIHHRQLQLQSDGLLLSGLDSIEPARGDEIENVPVTIRFHIHPAIETVQNENGMIVLSTKDGERWAFTSTAEAKIEKDIFFAGLLGPTNSQQIALSFNSDEIQQVAWIFKAIHAS